MERVSQYRTAEPTDRTVSRPAPSAPSKPDDPRVDLKELAQVFKRRRKVILWTAAVPVVLALIYCTFATPLYTASTQILIDPRDRRILNNEVTPEGLAPDGGVAIVESQSLVITSDTVLRRAIVHERLDLDPEFGGPPAGTFAALVRRGLAAVGFSDSDGTDPELKALRQLKRRIGVKRSDKSFVVDVYVTAEGREKSVRIADAVAQAYLDDQTTSRSAAAQRASAGLGSRLDALRNRLREAEERVNQYKEQHKIVVASGQLVNEQRLSEMSLELNGARAKTAEARARLEQIERARQLNDGTGGIPEAVASQTIGQLRMQYAELIRQRADARAQLGALHPNVARLNAQVRDVQGLINEELSRIAAAARADLNRAQASERALDDRLANLKTEATSTTEALVQLRELEREVEANRAVYEAFLGRARETGAQQSIDSTNARVISKATPPRDKSWPPRLLLAGIALVAGLGMGTGVGLMREYLDESVRSRRQLQELTGVPVLAVLPHVKKGLGLSRLLARSNLRQQQATELDGGESPDGRAPEMSPFAAAIRRLHHALFDTGRPDRGRSILITSAVAREGKTTVALSLALEAVASGQRVLLVDADFERHTLSKMAGVEENAGLADLLEGRATLASVVLKDNETGLNLLPLGNLTLAKSLNPKSELIVRKLLEPARNYGLLVVDCGAAPTDDYVRPFVDAIDATLLLVRAGVANKNDILSALEVIGTDTDKIRGTVLTAATEDVS